MKPDFQSIFARLREILRNHTGALTVSADEPGRFCLEGAAGPAAVRAWGGKVKRPVIPVAWVQIGKAYVSYHLMGLYGNPKSLDGMSKELKARMQGKTCFNFMSPDEALLKELEELTGRVLSDFRKAGYVSV